MSFSATTEKHGDVAVIKCDGKLTIGGGDVQLRDALNNVLDSGLRNIVIDVRNLNMMDSSGLGELIRSKAVVSNRGGKIVLAGVADKVREVLEMERLADIFAVFGSTEEALVGLGGELT